MEKITINWRDEIIKLFPETTTREIPEGAIKCDTCGGIGLRASENGKLILGCTNCGGRGYKWLCACGVALSGAYVKQGDKCQECKNKEFGIKLLRGEAEKFRMADKILITEYTGKVLDPTNETAIDADEMFEQIMDMDPEARPDYVWGTKEVNVLYFDVRDLLKDRADNDGYEDMSDRLDFDSPILSEIDKLINQWVDAQGGAAKLYIEDHKTALIIPEDAQ